MRKPTSYHYDFILTGSVMMLLGLIGLPPTNCVIPQAPLHTRSLKLRAQSSRSKTDAEKQRICSSSMKTGILMETAASTTKNRMSSNSDGGGGGVENHNNNLEVVENRVSGLIQSLLCAVSIFLVPAIKEMPTGVLWGYFAFMAYESLAGNELFIRSTFIFTDPALLQSCIGAFDRIKLKTMMQFTFLQILLLGCLWGVTQAGLAGISFPLFIMAMVPLREKVLPYFFTEQQLAVLDADTSMLNNKDKKDTTTTLCAESLAATAKEDADRTQLDHHKTGRPIEVTVVD